MHKYELVIVMDGKATAAKKKTATEKLEKLIKSVKGSIASVKDWGVKTLAYTIGKSDSGAFLIFQLELEGTGAKDISSKLRLENDFIRYLLIKKGK